MEQVEAKAYLTLHVLRAPVSSNPGPLRASFSVDSTMIPLEQMKLTQQRLQLFKAATNILNLHPYDPDEDEMMEDETVEDEKVWGERPKRRQALYSDEESDSSDDTDSERSEDGKDDSENAENDTRKSNVASLQGEGTARALSSDVKTGTESGSCNEHGQWSAKIYSQNQKVDDNAPGSKTNEAVGDTKVGAGERTKATWPQLMILGCGQLQANDTPEAEW